MFFVFFFEFYEILLVSYLFDFLLDSLFFYFQCYNYVHCGLFEVMEVFFFFHAVFQLLKNRVRLDAIYRASAAIGGGTENYIY